MTSSSVAPDPAAHVQQYMQARDWVGALAALEQALLRAPHSAALRLQQARCLLSLRRRREALGALDAAERCGVADPGLWDALGTLRSFANDQRRALACYDRAVALAPDVAAFRYNRASVRRFVGDLEGAESDYDRAIALNPGDCEAYLNRSELRVQTVARNHVAQLEALAAGPGRDWRSDVQICYALAKEYEDLGEYARSFAHLKRGAERRRQHLRYDVAIDAATVDWIIEAFPADVPNPAPPARDAQHDMAPPEPSRSLSLSPSPSRTVSPSPSPNHLAHPAPSPRPHELPVRPLTVEAPIFIVGLPRSGSTLVERILGRHSGVSSAGELDAFALALMAAVQRSSGRTRIPRRELVALSATLDFPALGRDYLARVQDAHGSAGQVIDKMPLNYLYCGLIRRALPDARIIHMVRHPMAVGYAMYKTLFKDGYPFSYDLDDLARYYVAYRRLMDHWQRSMPGVIHEVSYERLVADPLGETRRLLAHCGLDWEDACAEFHLNPSATTTASASQVRRPLYDSSVAQWRCYAAELAPLERALAAAGIAL